MRVKLDKEKKILAELKGNYDIKMKELSKIKSDNDMRLRLQEKNKMISEKKEEKNLEETVNKNDQAIEYFKNKLTEAGEDLVNTKREFNDMVLINKYNEENANLIVIN